MTIREAMDTFDRLTPNQYGAQDKLRWLAELDGMADEEVLQQHEPRPAPFMGYAPDADLDATALLIGQPYDEVYRWYLEMKVCDCNGEITKYNNAAAKYAACYQAFANAYNRAHMPRQEAACVRV